MDPNYVPNCEPRTMVEDTIAFCKFILCVLLTQFGKTFTAIDRILTELNQDDEHGKSIHVVFTMNTLLNNSQFAKRLEVIEETYGPGSVCVLASKYEGKYTHAATETHLRGLCLDEDKCPRVVVMCSNSTRFADGLAFLKVLNKNRTCIRRAFVYYDELHEYVNDALREQIEEIHSLAIVSSIVALTASPDKIWKKSGFWSKIRLIHLDDFNDANYAGHSDMVFNCVDDFYQSPYMRPGPFEYSQLDRETIGFITHTLNRYPDILCDGSRTFIPAHKRRVGHNDVRNLVFERKPNAVVVVLNGLEKTLTFKTDGNTKTISLSSGDDEVCVTIANAVKRHNLDQRPLVITGLLCVGMGQTLTHQLLGSFTSAIFGHMDLTNDELYQLFGRITGRMKSWQTYCQTQVYCPTVIMHRCNVMEECARVMATEHNGDAVTQDDYREPMQTMGEVGKSAIENIRKQKEKKEKKDKKVNDPSDKEFVMFDTQEEAKSFASTNLGKKLQKRSGEAPEELLQNGANPTAEYIVSRWWGINAKSSVRLVPTNENKWVLYWAPSKIEKVDI